MIAAAAASATAAVAAATPAPLAAKVINWGQLLEVIEAGLVAGVGISIAFSLVIFGAVRCGDARAESRLPSTLAYGLLAILALLVCIAAVFFGISSMLVK